MFQAFHDGPGGLPGPCICPTCGGLHSRPGGGDLNPDPPPSPLGLPLSSLLEHQLFGFERSLHGVDLSCLVSPGARPPVLPCRGKKGPGPQTGRRRQGGLRAKPRARAGHRPEAATGAAAEERGVCADLGAGCCLGRSRKRPLSCLHPSAPPGGRCLGPGQDFM